MMIKILKILLLGELEKSKADKGFTLIEVLVVIIIASLLALVSLPSFLNQANKAKQTEALQGIGAICRQQQVFYLEKGYFTTDLARLGVDLSPSSNYSYSISQPGGMTTTVTNFAQSQVASLNSYACVVEMVDQNVETLMCESYQPASLTPSSSLTCPNEFSPTGN